MGHRNPFLPVFVAGLLVLVSGTMAVQAGLSADRFLSRLDDPSPALSGVSATPTAAAPPRLARRVVVVIVDGLRHIDSYRLPFLDETRRRGIDTSATSHYPSFSRPNYVTIVTGVPPRDSGVRTNNYDTHVRIDSLMDRATAAGLRSGYVGDVSPGLPTMFRTPVPGEEDTGDDDELRYRADFYDARFTPWPGGFVNACRALVERRYELLVLLPGAVDEAGHEEGAESEEYRDAALRVDRRLRACLAGLDLERDTLVITADHGHTDAGGHGGTEPEVLEVPLILAGAGVRPGAAVTGARLVDVAPTVAALLGVPPPAHGLGRTLTEALVLSPEASARIEAGDRQRIEANEMVVSTAQSAAHRKVTERRIVRAVIVGVLLAMALAVLWWARAAGALVIDWRVLLIALPAFPVTYYMLLGIFGQQYSPSTIPVRGSLVGQLFRFGLISTAVHIVASWFALRGRVVLTNRLAAANGLTACGLIMALLPAAAGWAAFPGPFADVPGPALVVLVPATYVAVSCYAIAITASLALEIVVFFARAVDPSRRLRRLERAAERERARIRRETEPGT